jgi:hypothetical protein
LVLSHWRGFHLRASLLLPQIERAAHDCDGLIVGGLG